MLKENLPIFLISHMIWTFCYCKSLSWMVWIYNLTVTIIPQKIWELSLQVKLVNNRSIPATHAERKITVRSHKNSFTPYPSLSPYSQTDRITDGEMNILAARGLEEPFFQLCCCVSVFWFLVGYRFWCYLRTQSTIQLWRCVSFLVLGGNRFWFCIRT